ncbi:MAG: hypothetical protein LBO74_14590 [Candidatus Symbiothrix sp.]|jgi:hypothetical protein|nr:hypothetical protein [Candidatus Symbiothrix sp.]
MEKNYSFAPKVQLWKGLILLFVFFSTLTASAVGNDDFAGGAGTSASPWEIATAEQFNAIRNNASATVTYYKLTANIDLTSVITDAENGWVPIAQSTAWQINLDGQNHIISGLRINRPTEQRVALFGYLSTSNIRNLGVVDVDIVGKNATAAIVGQMSNNLTLTNIFATGKVKGTNDVGGLVAIFRGTATDVYFNGDVEGTYNVGGIGNHTSTSSTGTLIRGYAQGTVKGDHEVGGLFGEAGTNGGTARLFTLTNSHAANTVTCSGANAGALIGKTNATNTLTFTGANTWNITLNPELPSVGNGVANGGTGTATGKTTAEQLLQANYSGWDFTATWAIDEGVSYPIFQWQLPAPFEGDGTVESPYLISTQAQLDAVRIYLSANFKLANDIALDLTASVNGWDPIAPISDNPASAVGFSGVLDGAGYKITGLWENVSSLATGLFGYLQGGTIKNLGIEVAAGKTITGASAYYVGGLVGYANGGSIDNVSIVGGAGSSVTGSGSMGIGGLVGQVGATGATIISNSYAAIDVAGTAAAGSAPVGGFAGSASAAATIQTSYATGAVSNTASNTGGFIGNLSGALKNVYATGAVSSPSAMSITGGLIGTSNAGSVENSYAAGTVTGSNSVGSFIGAGAGTFTVTNSFALANGEQPSNGAINATIIVPVLSAAELKQQASFTDWDFTTNWGIYEGYGYPYVKTINNYILITPDAITPATYTGSAITPPALTWTSSDNYDATAHAITGDLALEGTEFINAGEYPILSGTVDLENPYYQISFRDDVAFVISKATQTITFAPETALILEENSPYTLAATTTSGLPVVFSLAEADAALAEIQEGNQLVLKAAGTITVTASVAANPNYEEAAPVSVEITITSTVGIHSLPASGLKATVTDGVLKVSGLTTGQSLNVYNLQGTAVYRQNAFTTEQSIHLPGHGVYVVVAGEKKIKALY